MKSRRYWINIVVLFAFIFVPTHILAEDKNLKVNPKNVESGGVKLESQVYDFNQYEALTHIEDSWNPFSSEKLDQALNAIANLFFNLTKMIASLIDTAIEELYGLNAIDRVADKVTNVSDMLYDNLFASLGVLLFIVAVLQIFFYYAFQQNSAKAGRATLTLILVIGVSVLWFTKADYYLKTMNNASNEIQGQVMKAGIPFAGDKVTKGKELDGSLAILRNTYFDLVVYKTYLLMNYGTPDEKKILKDDKNRIKNLLEYKTNKDGYKEREKIVENEAKDLENSYMDPSTVSSKIGVAFFSFIFAIVLGIPFLVVAFFNIALQILILAMAIVLGITLLLSILPTFSQSGWKNFEKLIGLSLMKAFVGLIILFLFVIVQLMKDFFPPLSQGMYMLNIVSTAVVLFVVFKFRDKIIETVTGGRVSLDGANPMNQLYNKGVKQPASKATQLAKTAVGGVAGYTTAKVQERMKNRNSQKDSQSDPNIARSNNPSGGMEEQRSNARKTGKLAQFRKKAVNLPSDLKEKAKTAKEAMTEDLPLNATQKALKAKENILKAKDNVVNMPDRARQAMEKDKQQGEKERQMNREERQQRREEKRADIQRMKQQPSNTGETQEKPSTLLLKGQRTQQERNPQMIKPQQEPQQIQPRKQLKKERYERQPIKQQPQQKQQPIVKREPVQQKDNVAQKEQRKKQEPPIKNHSKSQETTRKVVGQQEQAEQPRVRKETQPRIKNRDARNKE